MALLQPARGLDHRPQDQVVPLIMMMITLYNVSDHDEFRSTLLFFSRLVGEASPEVRAAAIRLAISTLVPIVGGLALSFAILRYESSTLILYKELSSPIFQSL